MLEPLPPSSAVPQFLSWQEIEPRYAELAVTPLSADTLGAWLAQWSRLSELIEEAQLRLWIEAMQDTSARQSAERSRSFADDIGARAASLDRELGRRLLDSELERPGLDIPLRNLRAASAPRDGAGGAHSRERELAERYLAIQADQVVTLAGTPVAVSALSSALEHDRRQERERCWRTIAERRLADRRAIDEIWRSSLDVRQRIAAEAGSDSYREYRWRQLRRFEYSPADCQGLAAAIEEVAVPVARELWERRKSRMGVDEIRPWDTEFDPAAARPAGTGLDAMPANGSWAAVFDRVCPEFGSYFRTLERDGLLDLAARPGKARMNFTAPLQASRRAFIFTQLNGGARDPFILFHEAGHAFHSFEMFAQPYHLQRADGVLPLEFAELSAMTMELIASLHLHQAGLCTEQEQARLRAMRLERALTWWLPACARIDSFQHWAYESPGEAMDPGRCDLRWAELTRRYFPWIAPGEEAAICAGEWRDVPHIFTAPFYFVEYAFATLGAAQISAAYAADPGAAISRYRAALRLGATATVPELFARAGATFAFDAPALRAVVATLVRSAGVA